MFARSAIVAGCCGAAIVSANVSAIRAEDKELDWDELRLGVAAIAVSDAKPYIDSLEIRQWKWPSSSGVLIVNVAKGGPADLAGLQPLDIIISVDSKRVASLDELQKAVASTTEKTTRIVVYRPTEAKGRIRFRRTSRIAEPISFRELVESQVVRTIDDATGAAVVKPLGSDDVVNDESSVDIWAEVNGNGDTRLFLRVVYVGDDWRFIDRYTFLIDGKRYSLTPPPFSVQRDNETYIWEWYVAASEFTDGKSEAVTIANALSRAKTAKVYFHGSQYREERELSTAELQRAASLIYYLKSRP